MTESSWQLDGLAFSIALEAHDRDRWPYPLRFRPEPADNADEFAAQRRAAAQSLHRRYDDRLHRALEVLLEPQVRVEAHGWCGRREVVRILVGMGDAEATMAVQLPGPTAEFGRDVILTTLRPAEVPGAIVARLPRLPAGGTPRFEGCRTDLDAPVYSRHPTRLSPIERAQRFFRRTRSGAGELTVYPGPAVDTRPTTDGSAFFWLDYPDDGRYLLQNHDPENFTVIPGPPDELIRRIQERITAKYHLHQQIR